jgi:hypothetical protein
VLVNPVNPYNQIAQDERERVYRSLGAFNRSLLPLQRPASSRTLSPKRLDGARKR